MKKSQKSGKLSISTCPSCGSSMIRRVKRKWTGNYQGEPYMVAGLEYFECSNCQEKIYPPEAMRRIQESSPAYAKPRQARRAS
jgi:YgiT-type zinc finger domain-containing protein